MKLDQLRATFAMIKAEHEAMIPNARVVHSIFKFGRSAVGVKDEIRKASSNKSRSKSRASSFNPKSLPIVEMIVIRSQSTQAIH